MITVPVSIGELADKISILDIKSERIKDLNKLKNIKKEQKELSNYNFSYKYLDLKKINEELWDVEENIRKKEFNNRPENIEKRRINSLKYYEKNTFQRRVFFT